MTAELAYWRAALRRRFAVSFATTLLITALALAVAVLWPPLYRAEAVLFVEPLPAEAEGGSTAEIDIRGRIDAVVQRMLTRTNLLGISSRLDLHDPRVLDAAAIVQDMRARTSLSIAGGGAFATTVTLGYAAPNPRVAEAAANALATFVLSEGLDMSGPVAEQTVGILQREARRIDAELDRQAERLVSFRAENRDILPDRLPALRARQTALQERLNETAPGGADVEALEAELSTLRASIAAAEAAALTLDRLERDYAEARTRYDRAVSRAATLSGPRPSDTAAPAVSLGLIESAVAPSAPVSPQRGLIVMAGLGLGVMAGLAVTLGAEWLDPTLRRPRDIADRLGMAPFATIPYMPGPEDGHRRGTAKAAIGLASLAAVAAMVAAAHLFWRPLDALALHLVDLLGLAPIIDQLRLGVAG